MGNPARRKGSPDGMAVASWGPTGEDRMSDAKTGFDPDAYATQAAAALGLEIAPAHRPGVVMNLALAARMAALVEGMPVALQDEPAPVFVARREPPK